MAKTTGMLSQSDEAAVVALIARLRSQRRLSQEERSALWRVGFEGPFRKMLANPGLTIGQATGAPGVASASPDYDEFRRAVKAIDHNLGEQLRIVDEGVAYYSTNGQLPAPYYAWRVAILLRKAKRPDLEADFCEAFSALFRDGNGARYGQIAERVSKARALASKAPPAGRR